MTAASIVCPGCGGALKLPPGATPGRQIRCPGCKHVLTVPAGEPPPDRAAAETQRLAPSADRAEAETRRGGEPPDDQWQDADAQASVRRPPATRDADDDDAAQSYGLARGRGDDVPLIGKVGRFELRKFLGQGAFGKVYLAYDPQLDRAVALKVPRHPPEGARGVKQFMVEATSAARLKHPNIVAIYEAGQAGEALYIASEYVEGVPLSIRLAERPPKPKLAARWVRDLAKALHYAHELGVVHRDIKPANVMIGRGDRPQLMDFGLALRREAESISLAPGIIGTPSYMAPEQARGEHHEVGPKSDLFALGVVLYELFTGATPFRGAVHEVLRQVGDPALAAVPPNRLKPEVPTDLAAVCLKALAKNPADRYRSAAELAADLQRWLDGKRVLAGKPPPAPRRAGVLRRAGLWVKRHPRRTAGIMAVLLLLAGGIFGWLAVRDRVREADRKLEEARRVEMARDADVFRERGARLGSQGKPAEGVALLARAFELAGELGDAERQRAVEAALAEGTWELPPPPGLAGGVAADWRLAGGLAFGVPVADAGAGRKLPHGGPARFTGFASGGARILTAEPTAKKDSLTLRDAATGTTSATLAATQLIHSPTGTRIFYADKLRWGLWDSDANAPLGPQHEWDQHLVRATFNHTGSRLLFFGEDGRDPVAGVWDAANARRLSRDRADWIFDAWRKDVVPVLSPDGKTIAYVAGRSSLIFWPVGTREAKQEMVKSTSASNLGRVTAAEFLPDGARLAVAFDKGTELWTASGVRAGAWLPAAGVKQIVFAPDGRHALLVNAEGARVWDVAARRPVGPHSHPGAGRAQFRPDGKQFLTASDGDTRVWALPVVPDAARGTAARLWAEATTGLEVTADGQTRPLSESDRADRRSRFEQLAGLPAN